MSLRQWTLLHYLINLVQKEFGENLYTYLSFLIRFLKLESDSAYLVVYGNPFEMYEIIMIIP